MASSMLGYLPPSEVDKTQEESINLISKESLWQSCKKTLKIP